MSLFQVVYENYHQIPPNLLGNMRFTKVKNVLERILNIQFYLIKTSTMIWNKILIFHELRG